MAGRPVLVSYSAINLFTSSMSAVAGSYSRIVVSPRDENVRILAFMFGLLRDLSEWKAGALTAMIARAADFYGPETLNGLPNVLVFEPFAKHQKASWLASDSVPHSYTY